MRFIPTALLAALIGASALPVPGRAADILAAPVAPEPALVPACDNAAVLGEVEDQFEYGAPRVLEQKLTILEFSHMQEKAYLPQVVADEIPSPRPIERRYCQAQALLSDHVRRTVYYVIEYPMGFATVGAHLGFLSPVPAWKAQGCVLGLDQWHVYGANCESLRRHQPEGSVEGRQFYVTK
ncbi:hypothetical protein [Jiella sp. M17.18]|uniref:hypothetical protein n=1 Tax=Jiella sp. M17.18 TaxID=3234247 RepID=UPI0034DEACFE